MDIFEKLIYNRLVQHKSVVLPGVGTLKVYRTAGTFDKSGNMVSAPINRIVFTDEIMEGETIVEMVGTLSGSPAEEIETQYGTWVKDSCTSNDKGINIGSVGFVRREADGGNVFEPSKELLNVLNPAAIKSTAAKTETKKTKKTEKAPAKEAKSTKKTGVKASESKSENEIVLPPAPPKRQATQPIETPPAPPTAPQSSMPTEHICDDTRRKGRRSNMFLYIVVALVLLLIAGFYTYSQWELCDDEDAYVEEFYERDDEYDEDNTLAVPVDSIESSQEVAPTQSTKPVQSPQNVTKGKFLIIGGLFSEPANADRFIAALGADSVYAEPIKRPSGNILVSVRSFDTRAQAEEYLLQLRAKNKATKDYWIHERGTRIW